MIKLHSVEVTYYNDATETEEIVQYVSDSPIETSLLIMEIADKQSSPILKAVAVKEKTILIKTRKELNGALL